MTSSHSQQSQQHKGKGFSFKAALGGKMKMDLEVTNNNSVRSAPAPSPSLSVAPPSGAMAPTSPGKSAPEPPKDSSSAVPKEISVTKQKETVLETEKGEVDEDESRVVTVDYTKIPTELDKKFEELDTDSALRPTIINPGQTWTKSSQAALLAQPTTAMLNTTEQKTEQDRAFDLLDALSRSGVLNVDAASLHIVLAATHCFDKSLMDTVIQGFTLLRGCCARCGAYRTHFPAHFHLTLAH